MKKIYFTEEERKTANREAKRRWYQKNKDKILAKQTEWRKNNKGHIAEYNAEYKEKNKEQITKQRAEYRLTQRGRAIQLIAGYQRNDKLYSRGECTLTADWIVDNIFSKPCHYCGRTDWTKLGCDRIDNTLPHTPDNVVPCCHHCNCKKHTTSYDEFIKRLEL